MKNETATKELGKRISDLRKQRKLTQKQLGEMTGLSPSVISNYEVGYIMPRIDKLQLIADALCKDITWFVGKENYLSISEMCKQISFCNTLPFYTKENIDGILEFNPIMVDSYIELPSINKYNTSGLFCTDVNDNSMINAGISKNSYIIVSTERKPKSGNIVAVIDTSKRLLIARTYIQNGPVIHLTSNGYGNYEPIIFPVDDKNYRILGTVVANISKLDFFD